MYLVYADESKDQSANVGVFCWVLVEDSSWRSAVDQLKEYRRTLRSKFGIYTRKELHARSFATGRGNYEEKALTLQQRQQIYVGSLRWFASRLPIKLIFGQFALKNELLVYERTINRINRTMQQWDSKALIIWDEGKKAAYTKLCRKLGVFNHIPSRYGAWPSGASTKNIPTIEIVEDPFFKDSADSSFIQVADFCAYSLLKKIAPRTSVRQEGLSNTFQYLAPLTLPFIFRKTGNGVITDE